MFIALIAIIVWLLILLIALRAKRNGKRLDKRILGPPTIPILGNTLQLKIDGYDFHQQLHELMREYGHDGMFRIISGPWTIVYVSKPEYIETLLSSTTHLQKNRLTRLLLTPWLGTGLLLSDGEKWRSRRKLLTPTFHFKILNDFLHVFNEQAVIMIERLRKRAKESNDTAADYFNICPYITECTLDTICLTAMGVNIQSQSEHANIEYISALNRILTVVMKRFKKPWVWSKILFKLTPEGREYEKCLRILHSFTNTVIEERSAEMDRMIANGTVFNFTSNTENVQTMDYSDKNEEQMISGSKRRLAFMDMLLYSSKTSTKLTKEEIREEVDTFMFEGHDTTSNALSFIVYYIGKHEAVQQRMQEEIYSVFGEVNRPATNDDLKQLKYMDCVIKESLRLQPVVPMFGRTLESDLNIGDYFLPKGTLTFVLCSAAHRDPKHFPDPDKFDPDRWLLENISGRHPYCYIPFSAGPRNCIGQKFAMMEMKVLLTYLLRNFNFKCVQTEEEIRPTLATILRSETGVHVQIARRSSVL